MLKLGSPPAAALAHTLQRSWSKEHWEAAGGGQSCIYLVDLCSGAALKAAKSPSAISLTKRSSESEEDGTKHQSPRAFSPPGPLSTKWGAALSIRQH